MGRSFGPQTSGFIYGEHVRCQNEIKKSEVEPIEGLLKPAAMAKALSVAKPTVYKLIANGLLPSVQWSAVGERPTMRIRPADLAAFIEGHRVDRMTS